MQPNHRNMHKHLSHELTCEASPLDHSHRVSTLLHNSRTRNSAVHNKNSRLCRDQLLCCFLTLSATGPSPCLSFLPARSLNSPHPHPRKGLTRSSAGADERPVLHSCWCSTSSNAKSDRAAARMAKALTCPHSSLGRGRGARFCSCSEQMHQDEQKVRSG